MHLRMHSAAFGKARMRLEVLIPVWYQDFFPCLTGALALRVEGALSRDVVGGTSFLNTC